MKKVELYINVHPEPFHMDEILSAALIKVFLNDNLSYLFKRENRQVETEKQLNDLLGVVDKNDKFFIKRDVLGKEVMKMIPFAEHCARDLSIKDESIELLRVTRLLPNNDVAKIYLDTGMCDMSSYIAPWMLIKYKLEMCIDHHQDDGYTIATCKRVLDWLHNWEVISPTTHDLLNIYISKFSNNDVGVDRLGAMNPLRFIFLADVTLSGEEVETKFERLVDICSRWIKGIMEENSKVLIYERSSDSQEYDWYDDQMDSTEIDELSLTVSYGFQDYRNRHFVSVIWNKRDCTVMITLNGVVGFSGYTAIKKTIWQVLSMMDAKFDHFGNVYWKVEDVVSNKIGRMIYHALCIKLREYGKDNSKDE